MKSKMYDQVPDNDEIQDDGVLMTSTSLDKSLLPHSDGELTESRSKKGNCVLITIFVLSYIALFIGAGIGFYFQNVKILENSNSLRKLNDEIFSLKSDLVSLQTRDKQSFDSLDEHLRTLSSEDDAFRNNINNRVVDIQRNVSSFVVSSSEKYSAFASELSDHDALLEKLTNHTSNAEVLDEMKKVQNDVYSQLDTTRAKVSAELQRASKNVSEQLIESHEQLSTAIVTMKNVVASAAEQIYDVQSNVTGQLNKMSMSISLTVSELNHVVETAQATIQTEVNGVREDIEQYVAATNKQFAAENDFVKYQLAGTFTLLGCLISLWHITSHLRHYYKPDVQRRVMAVLWMVPIYGITSWLSLVFPQGEAFLGATRDCYEAYVVYTFIAFLIAILEDGKGLSELLRRLTKHVIDERQLLSRYDEAVAKLKELKASGGPISEDLLLELKNRPHNHMKPPCPCCFVSHRASSVAAAWLYQCKLMAMQFVIMKPLLTFIPFIIRWSGMDYDGQPLFLPEQNNINWAAPRFYILLLQNISVGFAFYGLLSFYHGTEEDLAWCDPWPKFLCVKGVVFMTFWQGATLMTMGSFGMVDERAASQIQNLLICVEMLIASLAHFYIFPYHEWQDGYKEEKEREQLKKVNLKDTLALRDFVKDMRLMVTKWDPNIPTQLDGSEHGGSGGGFGGALDLDPSLEFNKSVLEYQRRLSCHQSPIHDPINSNNSYNSNSNNNNNNFTTMSVNTMDDESDESRGSQDDVDPSQRSLLASYRASSGVTGQKKWSERAREYIHPSTYFPRATEIPNSKVDSMSTVDCEECRGSSVEFDALSCSMPSNNSSLIRPSSPLLSVSQNPVDYESCRNISNSLEPDDPQPFVSSRKFNRGHGSGMPKSTSDDDLWKTEIGEDDNFIEIAHV